MPTINANLAATKDEYNRAVQGMRSPAVTTLHAGEALFRFASSTNLKSGTSDSTQWAKGPWWLREADYRLILSRYKPGGLSLGTVARAAAAVQPSWSLMDVSIKAYLTQDINVYLGKGRTQYRDVLPNGMVMTLTGWPDIDQVYIPNLRGGASSALRIVRQKIISTNKFGF